MNAVISDCGKYRYALRREWFYGQGTACFVMLNPSTADAENDDPTIRRCIGFAKAWNCAALEVVNLYAFRATDPDELLRAADPIGPENDKHILAAVMMSHICIAAWGATVQPRWERQNEVAELVAACPWAFCHLGLTKYGHPRHPLYVRADTKPTRWNTTPANAPDAQQASEGK